MFLFVTLLLFIKGTIFSIGHSQIDSKLQLDISEKNRPELIIENKETQKDVVRKKPDRTTYSASDKKYS